METSPPLKTPTILLISGTPGAASGTAATPVGMENVRVYLVIAVSVRVDIVCKRITKIAKDIRAIDHRLGKLEDSLSEIKDELIFIKHSITAFVRNTRLLNIEFK